jgi:putative phage-type endonuclease
MIEQGTHEWLSQRLGKVTASRVADVMATTKTGVSASRANYMAELIAERLTGEGGEFYVNSAMERGTQLEPIARSCYEFETGDAVEPAPFVAHPFIANSGASPDGFVGELGLIEIKCPGSPKHIATITGGSIDGKYVKQMQWQMACTNREWCDFVSYDPRLPVEMQLHIRRVNRDGKMIAEMEEAVRDFLSELDAVVIKLTNQFIKEAV